MPSFQPRLFEDSVFEADWYIIAEAVNRNGNAAALDGVLVDAMTAICADDGPAVLFQRFDEVAELHGHRPGCGQCNLNMRFERLFFGSQRIQERMLPVCGPVRGLEAGNFGLSFGMK